MVGLVNSLILIYRATWAPTKKGNLSSRALSPGRSSCKISPHRAPAPYPHLHHLGETWGTSDTFYLLPSEGKSGANKYRFLGGTVPPSLPLPPFFTSERLPLARWRADSNHHLAGLATRKSMSKSNVDQFTGALLLAPTKEMARKPRRTHQVNQRPLYVFVKQTNQKGHRWVKPPTCHAFRQLGPPDLRG